MKRAIETYFAVWVTAASVLAFYAPSLFLPFKRGIVPALMIVMLGMGLTLSSKDFEGVVRRPQDTFLGLLAQYTIMPLSAWLIAKALHMEPLLAVGVILVGTCPGGTSSNVITYLAKGDVALSVTMTSISTLIAAVLTPWLTYWLAGQWVPVSANALFFDVIKIVVLPVIIGAGIKKIAGNKIAPFYPWLPSLSSVAIIFIVAVIIASTAASLRSIGWKTFLAVALLNGLGLALGYAAGRLSRLSEAKSRAISIEVGMQNSGLAVALASVHFGPLAALPAALFSVWQNLTGPALAAYWSPTRRQR